MGSKAMDFSRNVYKFSFRKLGQISAEPLNVDVFCFLSEFPVTVASPICRRSFVCFKDFYNFISSVRLKT